MTDRQSRQRLHHKLIDIEDKPCQWCGLKDNREIDRIIEGFRGGKYIMANVRVLCEPCHIKRHNKRKFAVGDKVIINGRCPKWLISQLRHNRQRTITSVFYDANHQCCYYHLGFNYMGASDDIEAYSFRSYMLHLPLLREAGRPRQKRQYLNRNRTAIALNPKTSVKIPDLSNYTSNLDLSKHLNN